MPAVSAASEVDYLIANGRHLRAACHKHWSVLEKFGATQSMLKYLDGSIAGAESMLGVEIADSQREVEQQRQEIKDMIGDCRASARLVAQGIDGDDAAAAKALMVGKKFPHSDRGVLDYCKDIVPAFRRYGTRLATFGFGKDEQEELAEAAASFAKLLAARRKEKSGKRGQAVAREAAVRKLRRAVHFLRALGRRAFGDSIERNDFAPVSKVRAVLKKVTTPAA